MKRYLIEGSCDGNLFTETIDAENQEQAEALAVERLKEAWGEPDADLRESSSGYHCSACGREEADCSAEPCVAVIADREA
jgi:hypothetical protein